MQNITITGYLSKDAEMSTTRDGTDVTRWNVPVRQGWGDNEQTNWFRVSVWGKRADFASNARKGEFVTVTGDLTIGEYDGKPQYEIRANDFASVRTAPREEGQQQRQREPNGQRGTPADQWGGGAPRGGSRGSGFADDLDDDIPFISRDGVW